MSRKYGFTLGLVSIFVPLAAAAQEPYALSEPASGEAVTRTEIRVAVTGTAEFALEKGKSIAHPITATASGKYRERRLPGAGRDAAALRALRHYDGLDAQIRVADQVTASRLSDNRRLLVAEGRREGLFLYSPQGPLAASEIELLRAPGDSLCLLALLPQKPVSLKEKWNPASWVAQMLTDTEAASKFDLSCTLDSVDEGKATVAFEGTVEGATGGASGTVRIHGRYVFNLKTQRIERADIDLTERRTVGPISPGMNVAAKIEVVRAPTDDSTGLSDRDAAAVPLEPPAALTQLRFRAPWNVEFNHDRDWHVFQKTERVAVLRMFDRGTFVAQCNLAPVRQVGPGEHISEQQFQNDIRTSLGPRLKSIEKAEAIATEPGRFLYRVIAVGLSNEMPVTWIYYLCAAPNGAQVSFVFAVDTPLRDRLGDRDLQILKTVRFLDPPSK